MAVTTLLFGAATDSEYVNVEVSARSSAKIATAAAHAIVAVQASKRHVPASMRALWLMSFPNENAVDDARHGSAVSAQVPWLATAAVAAAACTYAIRGQRLHSVSLTDRLPWLTSINTSQSQPC